ncbi:MAG: ABC transporter ATP-binding protein [Gammaproteobacteria bacterium]|nr:MAG: ABC transporter ATP-binding protein [Gammaproteobacteria bacterium]
MAEPISATSPDTGYDWRYILGVAFEHKKGLISAHIVAIFAVLASVPIPLLMPLLVDEVLLDQPGTLVHAINSMFPVSVHSAVLYISMTLALTILLRLVSLVLGVWQARKFSIIAKDVTYRMRRALLQRLQSISMAEYETLGSGGVSSKFVTDLNAVDEFVASLSKTLIAVLSLVGITAILLLMHWKLALFILLMNPVVIYFTVVLGKRVKLLKKKENSAFELFQQALVETLDGIQQIRASNREKHYIRNVIDKARQIKKHSAAFSWKSDAANRFSFGIFLIGFDVFRAISMLTVVFSDLSIGQMMAVFGYLWFMMSPVQEVLDVQYSFFSAKGALSRINELLFLEQEPRYPNNKNPFAGKSTVSVQVKNISFAYGDGENVLNNVNLDIKAGEKVALVGASGGGKSTLVQVILGLYPAQEGSLYFDEVPVTEIGLDVVREHVATVLQHPAMFNDTVRNNLTLGEDYPDDKLWEVLAVAQLQDVIEELPNRLDAIIGRQGIRLSGGQQQRLAIARMLITNPKVVILDEATSALDTETEARLHKALQAFLKNRTTLIIAHRLSAVRQADRVYVFEDGHIIEEGGHEELMQSNGLYSKLYGQHH